MPRNLTKEIRSDRSHKVVDLLPEAHREDAKRLVGRFPEKMRVALSNLLVDAYYADQYQSVAADLRSRNPTSLNGESIGAIYRGYNIEPSDVDRG